MVYDTFENLATDWMKRDCTKFFDVWFVVFLKYRYNVSFFQFSGNIPHFKQFLNTLKRGSIIMSPYILNVQILIIS